MNKENVEALEKMQEVAATDGIAVTLRAIQVRHRALMARTA